MPDVFAGRRRVPRPENDPNLSYAPGTPARAELKARLTQMAVKPSTFRCIIGGKEIRTGATEKVVMPHKHGHVSPTFHKATDEQVRQAADAAVKARAEWSSWSFDDRARRVSSRC
jgi:1-pyrroline-5-carboxylate dehydrogenase